MATRGLRSIAFLCRGLGTPAFGWFKARVDPNLREIRNRNLVVFPSAIWLILLATQGGSWPGGVPKAQGLHEPGGSSANLAAVFAARSLRSLLCVKLPPQRKR